MFKKGFWYGREVEGRLADIETVFIRENIPKNFKNYPHIYFTIEYVKQAIVNDDWSDLHSVLETKQYVTVETSDETLSKIPLSVFNRVHLIYRIKNSDLAKLKSTDTLSIDAGWYRVHQVTKSSMMAIDPDAYKFDRSLE